MTIINRTTNLWYTVRMRADEVLTLAFLHLFGLAHTKFYRNLYLIMRNFTAFKEFFIMVMLVSQIDSIRLE